MEGKDNIKELFSQKLGGYEAKVNPELWAKISTQVAAGATTTVASGLSMFTKVAIGLGLSAAAITTVVLLTNTPKETVSEEPKTEVQQEITTKVFRETEEVAEVADYRIVESLNTEVEKELNLFTGTSSTEGLNQMEKDETEIYVSGMSIKSASTIKTGELSEPIIVVGVTHGDMTNYGTASSNEPETVIETPTQKTELIKRYTNIFTPNNDGINDFFELPSEGLTDFSVVVFNPKGEIVYQSNDPSFRWDGRDVRTGEMVDPGTYMYMVSAYDSEGNPLPIYERLTINR